jgi:hypothetical protein
MTVDSKEKKTRKNFIQEAKTNLNTKKRIRNPDDVNSTIRMSSELRKKIAEYCIEKNISMNKLIKKLFEKELEEHEKYN